MPQPTCHEVTEVWDNVMMPRVMRLIKEADVKLEAFGEKYLEQLKLARSFLEDEGDMVEMDEDTLALDQTFVALGMDLKEARKLTNVMRAIARAATAEQFDKWGLEDLNHVADRALFREATEYVEELRAKKKEELRA